MKYSIQNVFKRPPAVVVASYGRSGSTLVFESATSAMRKKRLKRRRAFVRRTAWTLADSDLQPGFVYKTHDYPKALAGRDDVRALFVFGKPTDAVVSVIECMDRFGPDWIEEHLDHLKAPGRFEDLLEQDALGLERQLDAWTQFSGSPVLCVRYEALWENIEKIQNFTQLPMTLPEQRPRSQKNTSSEVSTKLAALLGRLDDRVDALPDCFEPGDFTEKQHD